MTTVGPSSHWSRQPALLARTKETSWRFFNSALNALRRASEPSGSQQPRALPGSRRLQQTKIWCVKADRESLSPQGGDAALQELMREIAAVIELVCQSQEAGLLIGAQFHQRQQQGDFQIGFQHQRLGGSRRDRRRLLELLGGFLLESIARRQRRHGALTSFGRARRITGGAPGQTEQ